MRFPMWGGIECSVNRVGSKYYDQVVRTGHQHRDDDIRLIAELGVTSLRYPVLWERTAPSGEPNWSWPDARVAMLRSHKIAPIVGLVHHGSGPAFTSLVDPAFPAKLAGYARSVAERYPWITQYTPVNEPLTTARFSCLYGLWYPHETSNRAFIRALLQQCRGTIESMREIRAVNPQAQLVQTEDIGRSHSTPHLRYQAHFENERRWLSFDLLSGRVGPKHIMWRHLRENGASEHELYWLQENACPPDVFGVNYYITSERFIDERFTLYPDISHGGNGRERYADVEAVRVDLEDESSWGCEARLREVWRRYRGPIAVTECHLGCADEAQQVYWLLEMWTAANRIAIEGADVRGFAPWALLGSYDWDSLLTKADGRYEAGAFNVERGLSRTRVCDAIARLARGERVDQHANRETRSLDERRGAGWWRQPERIFYRGPVGIEAQSEERELAELKH